MALQFDKEFAEAAADHIKAMSNAPSLALGDIQGRRDAVVGLFSELMKTVPEASGVEVSTMTYKSFDGQELTMYRFNPGVTAKGGAAILYAHGGGMILGDIPSMYYRTLRQLSKDSGTQIFAPEYRLAPQNPHPGIVEDVYAGLKWLQLHAEEMLVDPARIGIQGDSAGGGISAGVALLARDRGFSPPLAKQILMYPMLDDTNLQNPDGMKPFLLLWGEVDTRTAWKALLGDDLGTDRVSQYAAPARARHLSGLPSTYVDVGALDLFCKEGMTYAQRLLEANVQVESHLYAGVPHAWELLAPNIAVSKDAMKNRIRAMMSF